MLPIESHVFREDEPGIVPAFFLSSFNRSELRKGTKHSPI